ncbi:MAG: hypothetical protein U0L26_08170, partial [Cellulosilyticum sp.]|nr:hypothetical protein [Cellulosilyticum sp.]
RTKEKRTPKNIPPKEKLKTPPCKHIRYRKKLATAKHKPPAFNYSTPSYYTFTLSSITSPRERKRPSYFLSLSVKNWQIRAFQKPKKIVDSEKNKGATPHPFKNKGGTPPQGESPVRARERLKKSRVLLYIYFFTFFYLS